MRYHLRKPAGFLPVLLLCTLIASCYAKEWSPQHFPNPVKDVRLCGRNGRSSWICDPDRILSEYSQDVVEGTIHQIAVAQDPYRAAHCPHPSPDTPGFQVNLLFCLVLKSFFISIYSYTSLQHVPCAGRHRIGQEHEASRWT